MMCMDRSRIRLRNCLTPRNKLLLILVSEDNSCLLHAVYLTASKVPASVKTQLPNSTLFNLSLEN